MSSVPDNLPMRTKLRGSRYARAYIDFFEDELVLNGYDWRKVVEQYLLTGKEPLINGLVGGRMASRGSNHGVKFANRSSSWSPSYTSWLCV